MEKAKAGLEAGEVSSDSVGVGLGSLGSERQEAGGLEALDAGVLGETVAEGWMAASGPWGSLRRLEGKYPRVTAHRVSEQQIAEGDSGCSRLFLRPRWL